MRPEIIQNRIFDVRGHRIILDFHLAEMYNVETKRLKEAVRRNKERFPSDFMFELTQKEWQNLRTQFASSSWGGSRYHPFAFTEHGITMLASILKSDKAIKMNIAIVRAFIALKEISKTYKNISSKIQQLEKKYNKKFLDIDKVIDFLLSTKSNEKIVEKKRQLVIKADIQLK